MLKIEHLNLGYEYLYQCLYNDREYNFNPSTKSNSVAETFLLFLTKKKGVYSENYLFRYLQFIFNKYTWRDGKTNTQTRRVLFVQVFGSKAYLEFESRDIQFDYQLEQDTILRRSTIRSFFTVVSNTQKYNNPIRKRFLNTDSGLVNCLQFTTLYDFRDSSCLVCIHKKECKQILQKNYPKIFRKRYAKNTIK
jgi:hypothetical protein